MSDTDPAPGQPNSAAGSGNQLRHARPAAVPQASRPEQGWAFIVGISSYQRADGQQLHNLSYCVSDAKALAELLERPSCGGIDKARMKVLLDEQATRDAIVGDLREFLRRPAPGDLVILYFACHGMPDPDPRRSTLVYLVAHDTDISQIARTGVPMREILDSVADYLEQPQRVLLISDTCYSGSLLVTRTGTRGADDEAERAQIVSRFFESVARSRTGTSVLASAGARQSAQEGDRWNGHGVFTHYLLKGLGGEADRNPIDNQVTVDELFSYVKDNVERDTDRAQRPVMSVADPDLVLAYTAGLVADDHLAIGRNLLRMAALLDDKDRFLVAVEALEAALRAAAEVHQYLPEAELLRGIARLMAGDTDAAIAVLDAAVRDERSSWPLLQYHLGLAQILARKRDDAIASLRRFRELAPDDERARWAAGLADGLAAPEPRRRALLIGVQNYRYLPRMALHGPANDVRLMKDVLVDCCGFDEAEVQVLFDENATQANVGAALATLVATTAAEDVVLIYFSGHSTLGSQEDYLVVYDTQTPSGEVTDLSPGAAGRLRDSITSHELHGLLVQISAKTGHLLIILDTHPNKAFIELASGSPYSVLLAATPGEMTFEHSFDEQGTKLTAGLLTYALVQRIRREGPQAIRAGLIERLTEDIHTRRLNQTPYLLGTSSLPLFPVDPRLSAERWVAFSLRRAYGAFDRSEIEELYDSALAAFGEVVSPDLHVSAGRAFVELGDPMRALEALERAHAQIARPTTDLLVPLAFARIAARQFDKAVEVVRQLAAGVELPEIADLEPLVGRLRASTGHALVVGISRYRGPDEETPAEPDAARHARTIRDRLVEAGFEVRLLLDEDARRQAIVEEFTKLCDAADRGPAVFYFAGCGSLRRDTDKPTLVSFDGRTDGVFDIGLDELARIAGPSRTNLVCLLDAGFRQGARGQPPPAIRFAQPDLRSPPATRDVGVDGSRKSKPLSEMVPIIGAATGFVDVEMDTLTFIGAAARVLGRSLPGPREAPGADWLGSRLAASATADIASFIAELSRDRLVEQRIADLLRRVERWPFARTALLLGRLIEKRGNQDPDGRVSRGVAFGLLGDTGRALDDLDTAIQLWRDAGQPPESRTQPCFEARYHYGRLLVEAKQDPARAMSELEQAVQERQDHPGARYYLGAAIRQMIEQEWAAQVEEHWRHYLELGAPLGHRAEVVALLRG